MIKKIKQTLEQQTQSHQVNILYACESGSRAWGFASPDSDYDVRFIYAHPRDWYVSVFPGRDVIEQPINDLLDVGGWDLRKALALLYKSNGALVEWLHSPIVYTQEHDIVISLRALAARAFRPRGVCHHYLGMANKGWEAVENKEHIKLKSYFYTLRALLCAQWIVEQRTAPPVRFQEILEEYCPAGEFREAVDFLLAMKAAMNESDQVDRAEHENVLRIVDDGISGLIVGIPERIPPNPEKPDKSLFEDAFRSILRTLEEH